MPLAAQRYQIRMHYMRNQILSQLAGENLIFIHTNKSDCFHSSTMWRSMAITSNNSSKSKSRWICHASIAHCPAECIRKQQQCPSIYVTNRTWISSVSLLSHEPVTECAKRIWLSAWCWSSAAPIAIAINDSRHQCTTAHTATAADTEIAINTVST